MKNIKLNHLLVFLMLIIFSSVNGQNYPKDGDNILNNDINKFVGTWKWQSGNNSFTIIFKKENVKFPIAMDLRSDVLIGFHKFINNGEVIENSTNFSNTSFKDKKNTLFGSTSNNPKLLSGRITHISKNKKRVHFEIEYIDANRIKIIKLKNPEGIRIINPGQPAYDASISLPHNIILTKQ